MNEQYTFEIGPDLRKAREALEKFSKNTQEQLNKINMRTSVSAIKDGLDLARQYLKPFVDLIGESITEALAAEEANRQLANSMRVVGDFTQTSFENMKAYADELARTTSLSDDQAVAALALAKSYSLTNSEAKAVVKTAADLSAVTGDSLNSSVEKLSKSYNGFVDRGLKQLRPELRSLTQEQLANGEAVRILGEYVDGSAAKMQQGMGGALNEVSKGVSELKEAIGLGITSNQLLIESVQYFGAAINFVTANISTFGAVIKGVFLASIPAIGAATSLIQFFREAIGLARGDAEDLKLTLEGIESIRLKNANANRDAQNEARVKRERAQNVAAEKAINEFNAIRADLEKSGLNQIEQINTEAARRIKVIRAAAAAGEPEAVRRQEEYISGIRIDAAQKVAKIQQDLDRKVRDARANIKEIVENKVSEVAKAPLEGVIEFAIKGQEELDKTRKKIDDQIEALRNDPNLTQAVKKQLVGAATQARETLEKNYKEAVLAGTARGLIQGVRKGAAGAAEVFAKAVGAVAKAYFGPLGEIFEELTSFLTQGADAVRQQINEFERAMPTVIQNVVEAIPAMFEAIIDNMPYVIEKSIEMIPRIFEAWLNFLPKLFNKIIEMLPRIVTAFVQGFIKAIPQMFASFGQALYDSAVKFVEAIMDAVTNIGGGIGKGLGISDGKSGSGNGFLGGLLDPLGIFAQGGRVPDSPAYRGDRFPARLDAGEQVFSRDLTGRLEQFLDNGGSAGGDKTVVIKVGEAEMARVILNLNRGGFRTA